MSIEKMPIANASADKATEKKLNVPGPTYSEIHKRALQIISNESRGAFGIRGVDEIIQQVEAIYNTNKDPQGIKEYYPGWVGMDFLKLGGLLRDLKSGLENGDFTLEQVEEQIKSKKKI